MDGAYVAVKFPGTSSSMSSQSTAAPTDSDPSSLLQDCRLLRIDELQVWTQMKYVLLITYFVIHLYSGSSAGKSGQRGTVFQAIHTFSFVLPLLCFQQVVKTGGTPKVPDCFQRTPKKLCIPEKAEILAVNVDSKGMSVIYVCVVYFTNIHP